MQFNYTPFGEKVIWINFKEGPIRASITEMNVSVTFHVSFFYVIIIISE